MWAIFTGRAEGERVATILVVDDEFDLRFVLRILLEQRGFDVLEAPEGGAALQEIQRCKVPPDVVVTDLDMPGMDGRAFIQNLRADAATRTIPIVVWSGRPDPDLDADLILGKNTSAATLVDELARYTDVG